MEFFDAHLSYGIYVNDQRRPAKPCETVAELDEALDRAGVTGGLAYNITADAGGVNYGNDLTAQQLKTAKSDLYGVYTIVPRYTHEIPEAPDLPRVLRENRMGALRLNPGEHRFLAKAGVLADYFEMATAEKIPVIFDTSCGITLEAVYDIMERFPRLTAILSYQNIWPADRFYRPFLAQFPNLVMELSSMITEHGIEELVDEYGAERLLFGSRFPAMYIGGQQLMLLRSRISEADKALIAGANLRRLLREAGL